MKYDVIKATYLNDYKIEIEFGNGKKNIVDFEPFFIKQPHPQYNKYYELKNFKKFKIEGKNLVWGKNWDLIFDPLNLYYNNLFKNYET